MSLSVLTWNVEWATPRARRTRHILDRIDRHAPEVVCLTETHESLLSPRGHTICSRPDAGYLVREGRRKVMLWSQELWERVDDLGLDSMPPGRFVAGVTRTSLGEISVVGVCIPWFGSRTESRRGPARKARWEDHREYLHGLRHVLERRATERVIVIGDFNQAIGTASRAPTDLQRALRDALPAGIAIATGDLVFEGRHNIDHIALSDDLVAESVDAISNTHDGRALSDHFGVVAKVSV
ncbi:MAG: endonuclease/exonuclease/phosphatase family protein [Chloroflexi bacterium]|nr:endonuclease/exonuclease/phosphatase family protein [Chloroflexota bacterium]